MKLNIFFPTNGKSEVDMQTYFLLRKDVSNDIQEYYT